MLTVCEVVIVAFASRPQRYGVQIMGSTRDRKKGPRRNSARAELSRRGICLGDGSTPSIETPLTRGGTGLVIGLT